VQSYECRMRSFSERRWTGNPSDWTGVRTGQIAQIDCIIRGVDGWTARTPPEPPPISRPVIHLPLPLPPPLTLICYVLRVTFPKPEAGGEKLCFSRHLVSPQRLAAAEASERRRKLSAKADQNAATRTKPDQTRQSNHAPQLSTLDFLSSGMLLPFGRCSEGPGRWRKVTLHAPVASPSDGGRTTHLSRRSFRAKADHASVNPGQA